MTTYDLDWMISVDDHVLEPPNVWLDRLPAKYRDVAPQLVDVDGTEYKDFHGGFGVNVVGHAHPKIVEASLDFTRALGSVWSAKWNSNGTRGGAEDLRFVDGDNSTVTTPSGDAPSNNFISGNPIEAPTGAPAGDLVVVEGIPFHALCEHHLLPFPGVATVG